MTTTWHEDLAAAARVGRAPPRAPHESASPIAKALSGGAAAPWETAHEAADGQGEQVPLRLRKAALDLAASLRKGAPPRVDPTARLPGEANGSREAQRLSRYAREASGYANNEAHPGHAALGVPHAHEQAQAAHEVAAAAHDREGNEETADAHRALAAAQGERAAAVRARDEHGKFQAKALKSEDRRVAKSGPSFDAVQRAVHAALKDRYPSPAGEGACSTSQTGPWLKDVFDDEVVFELDGGLLRLPYVFDGAAATLGQTPTAVEVSYAPVAQR